MSDTLFSLEHWNRKFQSHLRCACVSACFLYSSYALLCLATCKIPFPGSPASLQKRWSYLCQSPWRPIGLWDVEAPTFSLGSRFSDGGDVSLTLRPLFTPRKIPGTHFCYSLSRPQGHSAPGRIRLIKKIQLHRKSNPWPCGLIGNITRDLPACGIVPQLYYVGIRI
jgi:hypothetical protein